MHILLNMKRRTIPLFVFSILCFFTLCAFTFEADSSVRALTKPYINTYECTTARLGDEDLLEKFDYIKITLLNDEELEISFKKKDGKKKAYVCGYTFNEDTHVLCAEIGILGFRFKQETKIERGKFTLCMPILGKTLFMNFSA